MSARIALIGLSGAGKSTVAPLLAERLGFDWIDLDRAIEGKQGATIAAIMESKGEPAFRDLEGAALQGAIEGNAPRGMVVACGAGVLGREKNRAVLRAGAYVVWLVVNPETAARRLEGPPAAARPLLGGGPVAARLRELSEARRALYQAASDAVVETDPLDPAAVAQETERMWKGRRGWAT